MNSSRLILIPGWYTFLIGLMAHMLFLFLLLTFLFHLKSRQSDAIDREMKKGSIGSTHKLSFGRSSLELHVMRRKGISIPVRELVSVSISL